MAKTHTILEVFIASPGDVAAERKVLEGVVGEFNLTWGDKHKVRLEILKWETHTHPALGNDGQDVINQQISDSYDIFLGVMWGRFGTETPRADSGTQEEFERAYRRFSNGDKIQIMFYFKDAGIPPSLIDLEQIKKVQNFKERINKECGGLYYQFETTEDFQESVRIHLSKVVQKWLGENEEEIESKTVTATNDSDPVSLSPLANLTALEDADADEGMIDLVDNGLDAMEKVVEVVNGMGEATVELGEKFNQRTKELQECKDAEGKTDFKMAKRVSNKAANDLEFFVNRMSVEIPEFHNQNSNFMDSFGKLAMLSEREFEGDLESVESALNGMQSYRNAIDDSSNSMIEFRDTIAGLPKMTTAFNRARRRATAIMDDLLAQMRIAVSKSKDVEDLLLRLIRAET